jgi:hypothetical protein
MPFWLARYTSQFLLYFRLWCHFDLSCSVSLSSQTLVCLCHLWQWLLTLTDTSTANTPSFQGHTWWWQLDDSSNRLVWSDLDSFLYWSYTAAKLRSWCYSVANCTLTGLRWFFSQEEHPESHGSNWWMPALKEFKHTLQKAMEKTTQAASRICFCRSLGRYICCTCT